VSTNIRYRKALKHMFQMSYFYVTGLKILSLRSNCHSQFFEICWAIETRGILRFYLGIAFSPSFFNRLTWNLVWGLLIQFPGVSFVEIWKFKFGAKIQISIFLKFKIKIWLLHRQALLTVKPLFHVAICKKFNF